jgi:RNA polymerase sigma-70 factor (ECF subfamily)
MLRRADWAEEVLQESYVAIWNHAASYQPGVSAPMTWMTSIVRNRCLDWLRRPKLEVADEDDELILSVPSDDPGPLERLEASSQARALAECLKRLEERQRNAVLLAFFEGLSHSELAERLSLPLGTVKSWVRRGMERLKTCLST